VPSGLEYFTEITGIDKDRFVNEVTKHRHSSLAGVELPILPNKNPKNRKLLFLEQLEKWLNSDE
jgi:hypothetical protein